MAGIFKESVLTISIHALREEGDAMSPSCVYALHWISIHALREEGDQSNGQKNWASTKFLSTPSARRATSEV